MTVPPQPPGLIWRLTSLHHSLLFETFSSLGNCALALDCFPSYFFDLSLCSLLFEYSQILTKVLSFSLSLGHLIHNTGFNYQIMSHTPSSAPPPCFFKSFDAFALTNNGIGFFTKASEDPLDLIAAGLYVSFPTLMSSCPFHHSQDRQTGICIFEHTQIRPTLGHLYKLFIPLEKISLLLAI